jgi:hypothetical protein
MLANVDDNEVGNEGVLALLAEKPRFHFHKIRWRLWVIRATRRNTSLVGRGCQVQDGRTWAHHTLSHRLGRVDAISVLSVLDC